MCVLIIIYLTSRFLYFPQEEEKKTKKGEENLKITNYIYLIQETEM